jgi:GDP/UDP-N,N'-diacetylbacillosamine 2-epimerase (hydrolysing)
MTRKICVITGSRAEYGLLRWVMQGIKDEPMLTLQIIATGMHLSPQFGNTYQEIEGDGFVIDRNVQMLTGSDTPVGVAKSMGNGLIGFADALNELKPDLLVVLGDRFEIFSAVSAALVARIPVAHIHGGELTEGSFDDALRHSITKMSHLHFVAAEEYRNRVIQLGESPDRVFNVGGLGIDSIARTKLINKDELENELQFKFQERNLLVTFHPVTLEPDSGVEQLTELLDALDTFPDIGLIFTNPNADIGGQLMNGLIEEYTNSRVNAVSYASLGAVRYLSTLACVDGVIGNSSSGLLEAPSFKVGTVNIGDRQRGRLQAQSVIGCKPNQREIQIAITKLLSEDFRNKLQNVVSPYGGPGARKNIVDRLKKTELSGLEVKKFFDLPKFIDGINNASK